MAEAATTLTAARRACDAADPGTARRSADLPITALLSQPAVHDAVASSTAGVLSALEGTGLTELLNDCGVASGICTSKARLQLCGHA